MSEAVSDGSVRSCSARSHCCGQWLECVFSSVCPRERRVKRPTQTLHRAGDSRAELSSGWKGVLTVVAGAAAGHGARGRCSGVVLHFDDVWACVVLLVMGLFVVVMFEAGFGAAKAFGSVNRLEIRSPLTGRRGAGSRKDQCAEMWRRVQGLRAMIVVLSKRDDTCVLCCCCGRDRYSRVALRIINDHQPAQCNAPSLPRAAADLEPRKFS